MPRFTKTPGRLPFDAPPHVLAAISEIGRTEDVSLSPNGRRLAIAAFASNRIHLFSIAVDPGPATAVIRVSDSVVLTSDSLQQPHGVAFLDDDHIIVCNRAADVCLYRLPSSVGSSREANLHPVGRISSKGLRATVRTPGSVCCYETGKGQYRALVCNDQWHFVTSHRIALGERPQILTEGILIEHALKIPDGISVSPDSRWIAISNHVHGEVLLFENTPELNRHEGPAARLGGIVCPHGLAFDANGDLYVADAASPYLHVFEQPSAGWRTQKRPSRSIRVMENDAFYAGRYAAREGGLKGIHIDRTADIIITTHKRGVLEFHSLEDLRGFSGPPDDDQLLELSRARDADIARSKTGVLNQHWTLTRRLGRDMRSVVRRVVTIMRRVGLELRVLPLNWQNFFSRRSILDPAGPVVSLTTHSIRIQRVYLALECIARGTLKPSLIILWMSDTRAFQSLPGTLRRLRSRGLDIRLTEDVGPHTKYFPYVTSQERFSGPVVTADDDTFYPRHWLEALVNAHRASPSVIHCFRARRMLLGPYHFEPYGSWDVCSTKTPSHLNFITAVSGAIYPREFLASVKAHGRAFEEVCPEADDIWLTYLAFREGFEIAQVSDAPRDFATIPGTQEEQLTESNVAQGGNQIQLSRTFGPEDRSALFALQEREPYPH